LRKILYVSTVTPAKPVPVKTGSRGPEKLKRLDSCARPGPDPGFAGMTRFVVMNGVVHKR
jgi:hypothetical protein